MLLQSDNAWAFPTSFGDVVDMYSDDVSGLSGNKRIVEGWRDTKAFPILSKQSALQSKWGSLQVHFDNLKPTTNGP